MSTFGRVSKVKGDVSELLRQNGIYDAGVGMKPTSSGLVIQIDIPHYPSKQLIDGLEDICQGVSIEFDVTDVGVVYSL
jgi:hypothetical protein